MAAMKWASVVLAIIVVSAIVVNGQEKRPKTDSNQNHAKSVPQPQSPATPIVVVHEEHSGIEKEGAKYHAEGYLCRLFSPENLPSIGLFFVGLGGIGVGVFTLWQIRTQTGLLGQYVEATKDSVIAMQKSAEATERRVGKMDEANR